MTTNTKTKTPAVHDDIALFSYRPYIECHIDVFSKGIIPPYSKHDIYQNKMADYLRYRKIFCDVENEVK
jgi:hypothetical protein